MKPAVGDLRHVAARLTRVLGEDQCVLVGGLAVAAHGYVRATDDVDIVTRLKLVQAQRLLREHGIATVMKRGDPLEADFDCLKGSLDGVEFDVLPELVPVAWDQARRLPIDASSALKIVDLDSLVRLKFRAGGPQDLMDTAHLLLQHPEHLSMALEMSAGYGVREKLEVWLRDARVRSKVEQELRKRGAEGKATLKKLAELWPGSKTGTERPLGRSVARQQKRRSTSPK